jgi:hypothetical protein
MFSALEATAASKLSSHRITSTIIFFQSFFVSLLDLSFMTYQNAIALIVVLEN